MKKTTAPHLTGDAFGDPLDAGIGTLSAPEGRAMNRGARSSGSTRQTLRAIKHHENLFSQWVRRSLACSRLVQSALAALEESRRSQRVEKQAVGRLLYQVWRWRGHSFGATLPFVRSRKVSLVSGKKSRTRSRAKSSTGHCRSPSATCGHLGALRLGVRLLRRKSHGFLGPGPREWGREPAPSDHWCAYGWGRFLSLDRSKRVPFRISGTLPQLQLRQVARGVSA